MHGTVIFPKDWNRLAADVPQNRRRLPIFREIGFMHPLMNDTKWDELRLAMYGLNELKPQWRTLDVENGYLSEWDREWFHHFRNGSYKSIQWVEIAVDTAEQRAAVLAELVRIHVPGEQTEFGYRVFGYAKVNQAVDYIRE